VAVCDNLTIEEFRNSLYCYMVRDIIGKIANSCFRAPQSDLVKVNLMIPSSQG
jgi:hypothetical protein